MPPLLPSPPLSLPFLSPLVVLWRCVTRASAGLGLFCRFRPIAICEPRRLREGPASRTRFCVAFFLYCVIGLIRLVRFDFHRVRTDAGRAARCGARLTRVILYDDVVVCFSCHRSSSSTNTAAAFMAATLFCFWFIA